MANPATTHVIEIEAGIGEPAFIPLCMGQELQPISVGKKGMWRIESPKVLDVHAFVYFDGSALFLQSADESSAAVVDGALVGKAWTELHAPCSIDIGAARLRFRSLIAQAQPAPPPPAPMQPAPMPPPPIHQQHAVGAPAPPPAPPSRGRNERPFAPGAFSSGAEDESTRVAPLETSRAGALPKPPREQGSVRPAAGRPPEEDVLTRPEAAQTGSGPMAMQAPPAMGSGPGVPSGPMQPMAPMAPMQNGAPPGYAPGYGPSQPPNPYPTGPQGPFPEQQFGPPPQQFAGPPSGPYPQQPGFGNASQSGGYNASMGGFGNASMGPPPGPPQDPESFAAKWEAMPGPRKILLVMAPFVLLATGYVLLFDDAPARPTRPTAAADAGVLDAGALAVPATTGQVPPPGTTVAVPGTLTAPPPGTPGVPGTAPPTAPPGLTAPPPTVAVSPTAPPGTAPPPVTAPTPVTAAPPGTAPPPTTATAAATEAPPAASALMAPNTNKSWERVAVDFLAVGNYAKAAEIYEYLASVTPDPQARVTYSEAARILRMQIDAGTVAPPGGGPGPVPPQ
ncbi:MAG: hypothetical protein KC657_20945 [Myxococcales bacterium]|nr:hypothetical protein [Myxococcales bacterium]